MWLRIVSHLHVADRWHVDLVESKLKEGEVDILLAHAGPCGSESVSVLWVQYAVLPG